MKMLEGEIEMATQVPPRVRKLLRDTRFDNYRHCSQVRAGDSSIEFRAHLDIRVARIISDWRETTPETAVPVVVAKIAEVLDDPLYNLKGGSQLLVDYPDLDADWLSLLLAMLQGHTELECKIAPPPVLE